MNIRILITLVFFILSFEVYAVPSLCTGDLRNIQADRDHDAIFFVEQPGNTGRGWCFYSDDNVLDKPIIIAEGFDFGVAAGLSDNTTGIDLWNILNSRGNLEELRQQGYDFILLDYDQPLEAIQANALLMKKLIEIVNKNKVGLFENIVIGTSMGGLVAKTALAYMEYDGIDHDTSLYMSFDSPHGCAQVNIDLQNIMQFLSGQDIPEGKRIWEDVLRSEASLQMLCSPAHDWNDDKFFDLFNIGYKSRVRDAYWFHKIKYSVSGNGFPLKTRNVAYSNGSGDVQSASPSQILADLNIEETNILDVYAAPEYYPTDTMPGSVTNWFDLLESMAAQQQEITPTIFHRDTTFIPTMSAIGLGLQGNNYFDGKRSDLYWSQYEVALARTELPSSEEQEAATEGMTDEERTQYTQTLSLWFFHLIDRALLEQAPNSYLEDARLAGIIGTITRCRDETDDEGNVTEECSDSPDYNSDLSTIENLADYTPFDAVYLNFENAGHSDLPLDHSENFMEEVLQNTKISVEKIIPVLIMALN